MSRARTVAACIQDAIEALQSNANRHHARAHLARMAPERFEQINREWMEAEQAAHDTLHHKLTPEQKAAADRAWEELR